jgi:hypothetical protein
MCAAIVMHNVLRALGRNWTYVDRNGVDYLPGWYKANRTAWEATAARMKDSQMISLQRDGGGGCDGGVGNNDNCWGERYHSIGVIAYGIHEAALLGANLGNLVSKVVAELNQIYTTIIGGHEDPTKARIDKDAAAVAASLVARQVVPALFDSSACSRRSGYVAA